MAPDRQVALVTGCTQGGIGYELCKAFARANCRVFASARKLESMTGLPELGIETLQLDVTSADSRKAVVQDVVAKAGRIDILVNNAGMGLPGPIVEQDLEAVRALFDVNYFGLLGTPAAACLHTTHSLHCNPACTLRPAALCRNAWHACHVRTSSATSPYRS